MVVIIYLYLNLSLDVLVEKKLWDSTRKNKGYIQKHNKMDECIVSNILTLASVILIVSNTSLVDKKGLARLILRGSLWGKATEDS